MNSLDEKVYARECTMNIEPNGSWYIPCHGVHRPNKRDKMRVVYGSSSEFQRRSLNKRLLSGPDQIVSVLSRFREYDIAFMAETESVFYQLMVFKEGRCCLKLLC